MTLFIKNAKDSNGLDVLEMETDSSPLRAVMPHAMGFMVSTNLPLNYTFDDNSYITRCALLKYGISFLNTVIIIFLF